MGSQLKLKLLRDVHVGTNGHGQYFLYSVLDEQGQEYAWFAPAEAHEVIQSAGLKAGSEILVSRVSNGRNGGKFEVAILGKAAEPASNDLKDVMLQCVRDAAEIVSEVKELALRAEDARSIALTLFIARTKQF